MSAREVIVGDEIRGEYLPDNAKRELESHLARAREARLAGKRPEGSDPCLISYYRTHSTPFPSRPLESPQDLATSAELMVVGTVGSTAQGFYFGTPATVFEVAVETYPKYPIDQDGPESIFFVVLGAAIPVGKDYLCYTHQRGDERIVEGASILLALEEASELLNGLLVTPGDYELFYSLPDGSVSAAASYGTISLAFKELVASLAIAGQG